MKHFYITFCILLTFTTGIRAQKNYYEEKAFLDTGIGIENVNSKPSGNTRAGFLLGEKDHTEGFHLRYNHFLTKHWGVFLSSQFSWTETNEYDNLQYDLRPEGDKYYLLNLERHETEYNYYQVHLLGGQFRLDNRYFSVRPYIAAGITLFRSSNYEFDLKEKGTNQVYRGEMGFDRKSNARFCVSPGLNIVFKAFKRVYFYADLNYIHTPGKIEATQKLTDLYTGKVTGIDKDKSSIPGIWNIKFGLSMPFWFIR